VIPLIPLHAVDLPVAGQAAIEQAAALLKSAQRPPVMFGAASNRPRLAGQLTDFIRRTGMPYFNTQMGKGTVSAIGREETSELWMGTAVLSERDYLHEAIERADLILAIGHDTVEKPPFIMGPGGPMVIHVGYTPANVEQVFFPHAEVVGDIGLSLGRLADLLEGDLPRAAALAPLREDILRRTLGRAEESRFPLTPQRIVHDVRKIMPADGILALDNGMYKLWFARCYRTRSANTLLLDNALATMGAGLPSAMMAAILYPDRRVMAVCGDGGFMMNSQELETAVRLKLNLVVLIIQDDAYGMIRWKQAVDKFADWGLTFGNPDFVKYADAYGAKGRHIETAEALAPALESAFGEGGVQPVIVPVDYSENVRVFVEELGNRVMEVA
jgi:acetolactate synthase-1/2/3 large subunit